MILEGIKNKQEEDNLGNNEDLNYCYKTLEVVREQSYLTANAQLFWRI